MIAVNRDIMIRTFALLFAFAFFTAKSAAGGDVILAANEILINLTMVGAYFLDGLAAAAEQFAGRAIGARYRPAFERSLRLTILWGYGVAAAVSLFLLLAGPRLIDPMTTNARARRRPRLSPCGGARPGRRHARLPDGRRLHRRHLVGGHAQHDAAFARRLSRRLVGALGSVGIAGLWIALLVFLGARGSLSWRSRTRAGLAFS